MINYDSFKKEVVERFLSFLPEVFVDCTIDIAKSVKVNSVEELIRIYLPDGGITPNISLKKIYERYRSTGDLDGTLEETAQRLRSLMRKGNEDNQEVEENIKLSNVVFMLVNTEWNSELLAMSPHRAFNDLSIIYRIIVMRNEGIIGSIIVNNDNMHQIGVSSEEELYEAAKENSKRVLPATICSMHNVIKQMINDGADVSGLETEDILKLGLTDDPMKVISNSQGINGASVILYEGLLEKLAKMYDSSFYILPSSIHECLTVLHDEKVNVQVLYEMVHDVNYGQVQMEERLSDNVYFYDKDKSKLEIAKVNGRKAYA